MIFINLFFVVLNSLIMVWAFSEGKECLGFLNLFAACMNLIPVVARLM